MVVDGSPNAIHFGPAMTDTGVSSKDLGDDGLVPYADGAKDITGRL
jgi:hypothetical protein